MALDKKPNNLIKAIGFGTLEGVPKSTFFRKKVVTDIGYYILNRNSSIHSLDIL